MCMLIVNKTNKWPISLQLPQLAPKNGTIIPRYALLLNNLLEAVAVESPASLNLSIFNLELISTLGRFQFSPDLLELLAQQGLNSIEFQHFSHRTLNLVLYNPFGCPACRS